ncbi:MAG: hypothetical protein JZU45_10585 [Methyloversatilis discipulorum]|uniref:beta strand repeat-containing protein n=1 Tax=Methyloversatilis discipulorum TaxID=1119528 RepID=UPI0026F11E3B|nr:hypothetical protein [Methyloversatilis discipulorum]MBV5286515.1 hypothetical protein [Methyloversatilis discipulorum]
MRAAGGTIALTSTTGTNWTSTGSLDLDSGALTLGGNFNTASFNTLDRDGVAAGTLYITGALNNTGATLLFDDSTGAALLSGSITGGTLRANNPAGGALRMNSTGYLIDTTLAGVDGVEGSGLFVIDNGQTMEARGTLTLDGATIRLASTGSWTDLRANASSAGSVLNITGTGTIDFAGSTIYNRLTAYRSDNTLNVGSGVTLTGTQSGDIYMGVGGTFSGTALATTAGKTFEFSSNGGWTNAGTLRLEGGAIASTTSFTNSGTLRGSGNLNAGSNTVTNTGLLRPDGLLVLTGNLVLGGAGALEVGIAGTERGTQYDALDVSGTVTFGGTLRALHEAGFTPGTNAGLRVVRYNARMAGSTFTSLDVPAGFGYGSHYGAANYVLGTGSGLTGINEWINNSSGNWSLGSNWSLGAAPNSADQTVLIDRVGFTPLVTISTDNWTIGSLSSEEAISITGGSLTVNGSTHIGRTFTVTGGRFEALGSLDLNDVLVNHSASQFIAQGGGTIASFDQSSGTSTFNSAGLSFLALTPRGGTVNFNAAVGLPSSMLRVANYVANINADLGLATLDIDSGTVNLNVANSAADIDLGGGTLNVAGATTMSGDLTWTGGTIAGGGVLALSGVFDQSGNTTVYLRETTLDHSNTSGDSRIANTSTSGFNIENGGVLRNSGALTLSVEAPAGILYIDQDSGPLGGRFENTGTLVKTGAGRADIGNHGSMTFVQNGVLNVEGGSLTLGNAVSLNGTQTVAADAIMQVMAGTTTLAAGRSITGAGTVLLSGGTLALSDGSSITSDLQLTASGTLSVASGGSATVDGDFDWFSGTVTGAGTLTANGVFTQAGTSAVTLNATRLVHTNASGSSRIGGNNGRSVYLNNGAVFVNAAGAELTLDTANDNNTLYIWQASGTGSRFENLGTISKTGSGTLDMGYNDTLQFDQRGTLNIQQGLMATNAVALFDGAQLIAAGATLDINTPSATLASGRSVSGAGTLSLSGGALTLGDGTEIATHFAQSSGTVLIAPGVDAQISGRYDWTGGTVTGGSTLVDGVLASGGTLTVSGELQQTGSATVTLDNATLIHTNASGNSTVGNNNGRSLVLNRGAVFSNASGAVLTLSTPTAGNTLYIYQSTGAGSRFENLGTLVKTGAGTLDLGYNGTLAFAQSGVLQVNEGTLLTNAVATYTGTQQIAAGALLRQDSGFGTLSAGASIAGFGTLQVNGGTLTLGDGSAIASDLILTGSGNLNVAGGTTADIDGDVDWVAGNITGTGTLMLNGVLTQTGTGTVSITGTRVIHTNSSGDSRIGNNNGRSFVLNSGAVFRNAEDATLTLDAADNTGTLYVYQSSGSGSLFENLGTLSKTGSGTVDMGYNGNLQFIQGGSLIVQQGSMTLNSVTTLTGVQQIAAAATLNVRGGATTLASARAIEGGGTLSLTGGTLTLGDGASIASVLSQSGGTLQGSGTNLVSGRYDWTGGTVAGSGTLEVTGALQISSGNTQILDGRTLAHSNASGSSRIYKTSGALYLNNGAVFRNAAGARLLLDSGNGSFNVYSNAAGTLLNEGTLTKVGSGSASIASNVTLNQAGTFTLGQGTVTVSSAFLNTGTMTLLSDSVFSNASANTTNQGVVGGYGTFALGSRTFTNSGVVRPGGSGATGTLSINGNYVQDAAGSLQIERGNSGTDALAVSGTATLGGALVVTQLAGYAPTTLQTNIVTAGSLGGGFTSQTLPSGYSTQAVGNNQILSYAGAICGGVCWDGGAGTLLWTDAANWTNDLLPGATDLVFIDLAGGTNVLISSGNHTIASLTTATGNALTLNGGSLVLTGGTGGTATSTLGGDLIVGGGSFAANAPTQINRLLLSAGSFGGSGAVRFVGAGSNWTGGDMTGTGTSILEAGATLDYAAGTRASSRRTEIRQGATFRHQSGALTLTGGAVNAGIVDVALGAAARYGGSANYLLDSTGQYDGGGRIEFVDSAVVTSSTLSSPLADATFTVRVQDAARFTITTAASIANLEIAGSAQVTAQNAFQTTSLQQSGGTLTLNAGSLLGGYDWSGGTLAGPGTALLTGHGSWTRGTLSGNLHVATGSTFTISGTGSDDATGSTYKRFGAGSLTNDGTVNWQSGHIEVIGNGRVDNRGLFDIRGDFNFGDRWTGTGSVTLVNHAGATLRKSAGTGESALGSLGVPGGTANYFNVTNDGLIEVLSGRLRFNIGYSGASGGGSFTHNGFIDVGAGTTFEVGGALTWNGDADIAAGGTLRRIGGFAIASGGDIFGNGTLDVGAGNTLTNAGTMGTIDYGTLTVIGNYVQTASGVLELGIAGDTPGSYSQLAVSGSATLGGTLSVYEDPGYSRGTVALDLVTAGGAISGSFANIQLPDAGYTTAIAGNTFRLSYNALVCGGICWDGGAGTSLWTDAANWTGDVLPGANDLVFIALGGGSSVLLNSGSHTIAGLNTNAGNHLTINGASLTLASLDSTLVGNLTLGGGARLALGNGVAVDIGSALNWNSAATITGGTLNLLGGSIATLTANTNGGHLTLSGVTVNNAGTVNYASEGRQLLINDGTTFHNGGRFNFTTDGDITENSGSGGNFNNSGTIAKTSGTGRSGFASFVRLVDQGGSYRADSGTLDLSALATLTGRMDIAAGARIVTGALSNSGIIAGNGTLDLGGALLTNRGLLQPGGTGTVGTLTVIGGLQQHEVGRIEAEFAGTAAGQYDVLDVRGNTLLDGVLAIQAINGAQPAESMGLAMVTAGGTLEASSLALSAPSGNYSLTRTASTVRLGFTNCDIGICWDGGAGTSNWLDAANWTGDVLPGLTDLVFINLAGGADVVLNANPALTLAGLTIGDANSLTLTGGTLNAPTTIMNGGTLSLTGGTLNFGAALNNAGTLNYSGGALAGNLLANSGTLNVLPGNSGNLTTTRLNNTGSIVVDANRTIEFGSGGGMIFANDGDVQVRSGTLSVLAHDTDLSGPGADSGDYTVDAGATLRFRDAFRDFGPGSSITGGGDVEFTAFSGGLFNVNGVYSVGGTTRVSGNTLVNFNSNASFGTLDLAGNIGGTGTLTVAEDLIWTSGSIGGAGRSVIVNGDALLDGASLSLTGARLTVANGGLIDAGTRLNMSGGAQLIVATGASLGVGSNAAVGGSGSLVNRGTLEGTVGGGSSNIGVLLSNFGEVSASSGNLGLTGGIANTGAGSFVIGADATMELGGDLPPDIFDRIGGAGTLSFSPTSQPVINRSYAAQGGTPFSFSLRSGAVLTGLPQNGTVSGEAAGWIYTANAGFNGTDSARFTLSLGSGTAVFNISFAVTSEPAVTQPQVQVIATTLLPEVFQPPRIVLPSTPPQISAPINVASVDALSDIATASGPQFDQPLRDFRASRLQCR